MHYATVTPATQPLQPFYRIVSFTPTKAAPAVMVSIAIGVFTMAPAALASVSGLIGDQLPPAFPCDRRAELPIAPGMMRIGNPAHTVYRWGAAGHLSLWDSEHGESNWWMSEESNLQHEVATRPAGQGACAPR